MTSHSECQRAPAGHWRDVVSYCTSLCSADALKASNDAILRFNSVQTTWFYSLKQALKSYSWTMWLNTLNRIVSYSKSRKKIFITRVFFQKKRKKEWWFIIRQTHPSTISQKPDIIRTVKHAGGSIRFNSRESSQPCHKDRSAVKFCILIGQKVSIHFP